MKRFDIALPELGFIAATRGMAGAGIGLLLAGYLRDDRRKAIGWTLLTIGALTTVPIALDVFSRLRSPRRLTAVKRSLGF
ncbi:MAG TPA: hypothetical protein VKG21_10610 [Casimicrobiaceae bacterium]|nr:hypothetical protein [Casimicrobiaceae bacterium]